MFKLDIHFLLTILKKKKTKKTYSDLKTHIFFHTHRDT